MYLPPHFTQTDAEEINAFIDAYPFATVITIVDGEMWPTQIPLFRQNNSTLVGHVARANQMWRHDATQDTLVVFSGPDTYITPNWYETKRQTHKAVPTWNYASVNIWAKMTPHHDARWKRMAVGKLTNIHERHNSEPWKMGDAPQDYLEEQLEHIVGVEFAIRRLEAKWKLNQNRTVEDREGVVIGLTDRNREEDAAIATMMRVSLADARNLSPCSHAGVDLSAASIDPNVPGRELESIPIVIGSAPTYGGTADGQRKRDPDDDAR